MNRGFGIGVPAMGPGAGFGANNGRVMQSRRLPAFAPVPDQAFATDPTLLKREEAMRAEMALRQQQALAQQASQEKMAAPAQAPAQQFPASPVQAPKDRGMFGRFLGGLGKVAGKAGEFAMFGPVGMQIRADHRRGVEKEEQKTAEKEARRQQMLQQFAGMEGLTPQQQMLIRNGFGVEQLAEQQFATPAAAKFGLDLKEVRDPVTGETRLVQASEAGGVRAVEGFVPAPPAPDQRPWWAQDGGGVDPAQLANQAAGRSPGVNINMPGEGPQETAFMREAGALEAKNFGSLVEMGQTARRNRVTLDQLDVAAASIPGGLEASAKAALGNMGIETEGLSEIQATEALINQLVPAQRAPGSGPMSDRDLALFKQSLPRLIQSADGRAKILTNMKAINDYVVREGQIANRVLSGEITPQEGRSQIEALGNPLVEDDEDGLPPGFFIVR
jgi:hypothetical protein